MSAKLFKEAAINAAFGAIIMFGITLLAGGWQLKKPKPVQDSPELHDVERMEVEAPTAEGEN